MLHLRGGEKVYSAVFVTGELSPFAVSSVEDCLPEGASDAAAAVVSGLPAVLFFLRRQRRRFFLAGSAFLSGLGSGVAAS